MHELQEKIFDLRIKSDGLRNDNLLLGTLQCWGFFEDSARYGVNHEHQQK